MKKTRVYVALGLYFERLEKQLGSGGGSAQGEGRLLALDLKNVLL